MPNYRRAHVAGGTYFFTLVTHRRRPLFADHLAIELLGDCFREAIDRWPFEMKAVVLLPDHLHAIWSLPSGDEAYPTRWSWIKKEFTQRWLDYSGNESEISDARQRERRRGVWQPRYWEHTLQDEDDFERHFDYIHFNPVKHGYVRCPFEWPHSSFHRWVKEGVYPWHWACWSDPRRRAMVMNDMSKSVGE